MCCDSMNRQERTVEKDFHRRLSSVQCQMIRKRVEPCRSLDIDQSNENRGQESTKTVEHRVMQRLNIHSFELRSYLSIIAF